MLPGSCSPFYSVAGLEPCQASLYLTLITQPRNTTCCPLAMTPQLLTQTVVSQLLSCHVRLKQIRTLQPAAFARLAAAGPNPFTIPLNLTDNPHSATECSHDILFPHTVNTQLPCSCSLASLTCLAAAGPEPLTIRETPHSPFSNILLFLSTALPPSRTNTPDSLLLRMVQPITKQRPGAPACVAHMQLAAIGITVIRISLFGIDKTNYWQHAACMLAVRCCCLWIISMPMSGSITALQENNQDKPAL